MEIPLVDLTNLQPSLPSGERWEAAKTAAAAALQSHGFFEAVYPSLSAELREEMLGRAAPELFSLPLESKLRLISEEPYQGYILNMPHLDYESMRIDAVDSPIAVRDFTRLMWPQGNPSFYNAAVAFAKPLRELAEMVQKMIIQSLGVDQKKNYESFVNSTAHGIRLSRYGVPLNQETKIALRSHLDQNLLSIVCQHEVGGLEFQIADGSWVNARPSPTSVHVMAGLAFQAWSNMSVRAPVHRVRMLGNEKRFSAIYGTRPSHNSIVRSPEELASRRPLLYKPFNYTELVRFMYSQQEMGKGPEDAFNSYCKLGN